MVDLLKLRRRTAIRRLNTLSYDLFQNNGINCMLHDDLTVWSANTESDEYGCAFNVNIGVNEISYSKSAFSNNRKVSDKDFAHIVLNMYHEQMHCIQKNKLFRQAVLDENITNQLVQDIACVYNPIYYTNNNYRYNANEIQAESYGIMKTYDYLCTSFPDVDKSYHESLILDIVNEKMFNSTYFVSRQETFVSLYDVEQAFDDAYDESFQKSRIYYVNNKNNDDVAKLWMDAHPEAKEVYLNCNNALEQDRCIAAITIAVHPELKNQFPGLDMNELSYENVIMKPYNSIHSAKTPEQLREEAIREMLSKPASSSVKSKSRIDELESKFGHISDDYQQDDFEYD